LAVPRFLLERECRFSALVDNLEAGVSLDEFVENFPSVTHEQAVQVLEYFKSSLDKFEKAA
jgi:uncharacterized protein (DUF433 family)